MPGSTELWNVSVKSAAPCRLLADAASIGNVLEFLADAASVNQDR